ncbi:MAG TPA: AarF/UbiB family protein [Burkholderiales bacterium]|jgi:ubiquinone biosynthesis protein|nr:AarF/UbiB family protein [Burkholderiales bacterium]
MLRETLGAMRDLPRLQEITTVFIRHGLGDIVRRIGIANVLERAGQMLHWSEGAASLRLEPAQRMRLAFEELGPTFIKFGQVLATRVDLLPPHWIAEFEKLHSEVPPVRFEELLPELERALGRSPFELFRDLETVAHGSASIAQVHRARLNDGTPVVLKVRRPGIRVKIDADLRILGHIAELIEAEMPDARRYRPVEIAAEFSRSLGRELDFTTEARHVERFAANFAGDPYIVIPRVYPEWTSETLLVQQHVAGIPGTDHAAVDAAGLDKTMLMARGADCVLKMILIDGFFHADPHPGNVFYLPGNRIVMIDYGMVGRLSAQRRRQVVDLLAGLARLEEEPMLEVLTDWAGDAQVDETRLISDVNELVFDYEMMPLKDIRIGVLIRHFAAIVRKHSIVLPSDLTLMFKALITLEGLGRQYDPEFHISQHLTPWLRRALRQRYRPAEIVKRGRGAVTEFLGVIGGVPRDLARLLREARRGKVRVDFDLKRLDSFGRQLDRTLDRATVGILTASLVIGSSIVLTVRGGPSVFGIPVLPVLGLFGYVLAFLNSLWIIYGIWRSGKQ